MGRRQSFQQMALEQLDMGMQKKKKQPQTLYPSKINSKGIIEINVKHKTIKLLADNMGENLENLDDLGFSDDFLDRKPKA